MTELLDKINDIQRQLDELKASSTIPLDVDAAFRSRFGIDSLSSLISSTKSATSENQAVNEGGSASYSVLKAPDGFLQVQISGVTYFIPIFT